MSCAKKQLQTGVGKNCKMDAFKPIKSTPFSDLFSRNMRGATFILGDERDTREWKCPECKRRLTIDDDQDDPAECPFCFKG